MCVRFFREVKMRITTMLFILFSVTNGATLSLTNSVFIKNGVRTYSDRQMLRLEYDMSSGLTFLHDFDNTNSLSANYSAGRGSAVTTNGGLTPSTGFISGGKDGRALKMVRTNNNLIFDSPSNFSQAKGTLEFWFRHQNSPGLSLITGYPSPFGVKTAGGKYWETFRTAATTWRPFLGTTAIETGESIPSDTWVHLALTWEDGKEAVAFVNGKMLSSKKIAYINPSLEDKFRVGGYTNGEIDSLRIHKTIRYNGDFTPGHGPYLSSGSLTSTKINSADAPIYQVSISGNADLPAGTSFLLEVSDNGGDRWRQIETGERIFFDGTGKDLRLKGSLSSSDANATPSLTDYTLEWSHLELAVINDYYLSEGDVSLLLNYPLPMNTAIAPSIIFTEKVRGTKLSNFSAGSGTWQDNRNFSFSSETANFSPGYYSVEIIAYDATGDKDVYNSAEIFVYAPGSEFKEFSFQPGVIIPGSDGYGMSGISLDYPGKEISITIFSPDGTIIKTIADREKSSSVSTFYWDGENENGGLVPFGVYPVKITVGNQVHYSKIAVVREGR